MMNDDLIDKVIPLYTQMIGNKEGVGIIEKGTLNLVFNNGMLFLNWQNKLVTPNQGGYTVFSVTNKWYSSSQADWEVRKEGENKLVAIGKFYQLALTQIWRIELTNNYEIKWNIEIASEEPFEIEEGYTNIMLTSEYTQWFTPLEEGVFPSIDEKNNSFYHLLDGNLLRGCVGVRDGEALNGWPPSFLFEQSNNPASSFAQISNTDYLSNCRVLQFKTIGLQNYSGSQTSHFSYFSGRILLDMHDIDVYLKSLQDGFTLSGKKLKLTFSNGQGALSYDGKELTKGSHIGSAIYINGRWYHSRSAQWKVDKERDDKLVAYGVWQGLPIAQIWEIEALKENCFLWKVKLLIKESVNIEEQYIDFLCSKDYTHWFCDYGQGKFSNDFLEVTMDMLQKCIPDGIVGLHGCDIRLPAICLKFSKELSNFAKILNSDFYNRTMILRINRVEPEEKVKFVPGEYPCFMIEFIFDEDKKNNSMHILPNILEDGKLRFIFERGRGRVYWDEVELTKRLGVYTSLRSAGHWYDSLTGVLWKSEEKKDETVRVEGKWICLPISQYWRFWVEHNFIEFEVKMSVDKKIEVDRLQTNVMLSEKYFGWITEKNEGRFPFFKDDVNDDWDCIYSPGDGSRYIGVAGNITDKIFLPPVLLLPRPLNPDWSLNIINSDIYHRGRVLQHLSAKKTQIYPGEYPYFSGRISVQI